MSENKCEGCKLLEIRTKLNITQQVAADRIGTYLATYIDIEKGRIEVSDGCLKTIVRKMSKDV